MDAKWRFGATLIIWGFMGTISILALVASMTGDDVSGWAFFTPMVIAFISMLPLWASDSSGSSKSEYTRTKTGGFVRTEEKSDNTPYTMALLMEMMDDDEREEFKYDLKRRILSGEQLTNESLVEELDKRKRG